VNAFIRHHQSLIRFGYSCFDRILCLGGIQAFQRPAFVAHFLKQHRHARPVTPAFLRRISADYHRWLEDKAARAGVPIVEPAAEVRREEWVRPYFERHGQRPGTAVILKCRERARVAVSLPSRGHFIELQSRCVNLYYFYHNDPQCGRLFVRLCPYFPFNTQLWVNGHHWLARQLDRAGIAYEQRDNAFVDCAAPRRLQELADAFGPADLLAAQDAVLAEWLAFFTPQERAQGYRHHLYVAQVEYCHNLVFHRRAALGQLFERLLDHNRRLGHPDKLAIIFGRPTYRPDTRTGETLVKVTPTRTQVISSRFGSTSLKQYVKDNTLLRTEAASYRLADLSVPQNVQQLPRVRAVLSASNERYLEVQQDVLVSHVDRGQLEQLRRPSVSPGGRRTPGLHSDDRRLLALLQALLCLVHLVGKGCFRTKALLADVRQALDRPDYRLSQLRYDVGKLRGKGLVQRLPRSQQYRLSPEGYRVAVIYCKLYQRLYAPLVAGVLDPFAGDVRVPPSRQAKLDRLYRAVDQALQRLSEHVGLSA
jgi:hypothetical protein